MDRDSLVYRIVADWFKIGMFAGAVLIGFTPVLVYVDMSYDMEQLVRIIVWTASLMVLLSALFVIYGLILMWRT